MLTLKNMARHALMLGCALALNHAAFAQGSAVDHYATFSHKCISSPLIDLGADQAAYDAGEKSFPVQIYGYALGQNVDHFKVCDVDALGLPTGWGSFYQPELCFWENKGAMEVTKGLFLTTARHGGMMPSGDTYEDKETVCGTGLMLGLDEDGRVVYMDMLASSMKDQEYIFEWLKGQLGEPDIYAVVDGRIKQMELDRSLPLEIRSFWAQDGAIIAYWKKDEFWVRFLGGKRIDIGYNFLLDSHGAKLSNWDIRRY